jgi:hypothetical protein
VGFRRRIKKLEREAEAEKVTLVCRGCGEEMTVADGPGPGQDTALGLVVYEWEQGMREVGEPRLDPEVRQPTPPDVLVITSHPCGWGSLEEKATGKPWPFMDVGGGMIGLTR